MENHSVANSNHHKITFCATLSDPSHSQIVMSHMKVALTYNDWSDSSCRKHCKVTMFEDGPHFEMVSCFWLQIALIDEIRYFTPLQWCLQGGDSRKEPDKTKAEKATKDEPW